MFRFGLFKSNRVDILRKLLVCNWRYMISIYPKSSGFEYDVVDCKNSVHRRVGVAESTTCTEIRTVFFAIAEILSTSRYGPPKTLRQIVSTSRELLFDVHDVMFFEIRLVNRDHAAMLALRGRLSDGH